MSNSSNSDEPATSFETRQAITESSGRGAFPIRRSFLQEKKGRKTIPGPMARLVETSDRSGLLLYSLAVTKASSAPWDIALPASVWARALDLPNPTSATTRSRISKTWTRLVNLNLLLRSRRANTAVLTLLKEDGSGKEYTHPGVGRSEPYIQIPHALWLDGPDDGTYWFEALKLPALAFLYIARCYKLGQNFGLAAERVPDYYGISADTFQRGARQLRNLGLVEVTSKTTKAPLAPLGVTVENRYRLLAPFDT